MSDSALVALVMIVFILTSGGTILLRPLTKRLADYLEVKTRRDPGGVDDGEVRRLREALEVMSGRLALLEERQDFTEKILTQGRPRSVLLTPDATSPEAPPRPAANRSGKTDDSSAATDG